MKSYRSNGSKSIKGTGYRSRYAYGRKEKKEQPNPEKVRFEFSSLRRDDDMVRQMTMIAESEESDTKKDSETERERVKHEALRRGEEVRTFIESELKHIDKRKYGMESNDRPIFKIKIFIVRNLLLVRVRL